MPRYLIKRFMRCLVSFLPCFYSRNASTADHICKKIKLCPMIKGVGPGRRGGGRLGIILSTLEQCLCGVIIGVCGVIIGVCGVIGVCGAIGM